MCSSLFVLPLGKKVDFCLSTFLHARYSCVSLLHWGGAFPCTPWSLLNTSLSCLFFVLYHMIAWTLFAHSESRSLSAMSSAPCFIVTMIRDGRGTWNKDDRREKVNQVGELLGVPSSLPKRNRNFWERGPPSHFFSEYHEFSLSSFSRKRNHGNTSIWIFN